jgi:glucan 1,3-beta-glucosidase
VEQVVKIEAEFRAKFPGKPVRIGETGWPSKGRMRGPGHAGLIEEARFVRGFAARAAAIGLRYNLIEAIDQPWKRVSEGTVGGYWGILDEHRRPKFPLTGPVSGRPEWRREFAVSAAVALALLALGLVHRRGTRAWLGLAVLATALGILAPFQWDYFATTTRNAWGWIAGVAALGANLAAVAMIDGILRGIPRTPSAPLAELPRAFGAPRRLLHARSLGTALWVAIVTLSAAWLGLTFAFDPRFRDVPVAWFALPALAIALRFGRLPAAPAVRREEALLAAIVVVAAGLQLAPLSPESLAWLLISALIALPWVPDLRRSLRRDPDRA